MQRSISLQNQTAQEENVDINLRDVWTRIEIGVRLSVLHMNFIYIHIYTNICIDIPVGTNLLELSMIVDIEPPIGRVDASVAIAALLIWSSMAVPTFQS